MTPGKNYIFATDLVEYLESKGIKVKKQLLNHKKDFRLVIQIKDKTDPAKFVTAFPFSNNLLDDIDKVGFTKKYLTHLFPKIIRLEEYSSVKLSIDDLKEQEYK
ncbi:MAG: hypothetical protein L6Q54_06350 [Leptospiraceae bacterium]|nr:hypothetical protein [Leptospiraceae bacterium]MCK6380857.1 hypothetical protein [Leptospiraceae bacterium]